MYLLSLLAAHLAVCVLMGWGVVSGRLRAPAAALPLVVFVPLWGTVCLLALTVCPRRRAGIGLEKLRVNEEIYRSFVTAGPRQDAAPMEDVLLLDDAGVRRSRMMELLSDRPERYLPLLRQASRNEDVEVVHYATTALAELNKDCDLRLQRAEKRYADDPDDAGALEEYLSVLGDSLQKEMAPGRILRIYRRQYAALLEKRQRQTPTLQNGETLVRQLMLLEEFDAAERELDALLRRWPDQQAVWLLRVEYAARRHDGALLRKTLLQARAGGVWFDEAARRTLDFWRGEAAG